MENNYQFVQRMTKIIATASLRKLEIQFASFEISQTEDFRDILSLET